MGGPLCGAETRHHCDAFCGPTLDFGNESLPTFLTWELLGALCQVVEASTFRGLRRRLASFCRSSSSPSTEDFRTSTEVSWNFYRTLVQKFFRSSTEVVFRSFIFTNVSHFCVFRLLQKAFSGFYRRALNFCRTFCRRGCFR